MRLFAGFSPTRWSLSNEHFADASVPKVLRVLRPPRAGA